MSPKDLRKKGKIWWLLKSLYGTRDASQVFATYVEEGLNEHGFQRNAVAPCLYWAAALEALGVRWKTIFIFGISDDRANDLQQLMREMFKVKICERVGLEFLTAAEFFHREVARNAKDSPGRTIRTHTHTQWQCLVGLVSTARGNSSKRSGTSLWLLVRKQGKGLRDGADNLDEQETQRYRSLVGTALYVGQDRPETQCATKEAARFMSGPTSAARCMLKRLCKYCREAPVLSWSFPCLGMPSEIRAGADANWAGELEGLRSTSCGWIYFGDHLLRIRRHSRLWRCQLQRVSTSRSPAHALEVRSATVQHGLTLKVVCETDASAGRAMATRRGVGRVRHLCAIVGAAAVVCRRRGGSVS